MSFGKEAMLEMDIETEMTRARIVREAEKRIWTTRDGRRIPVESMTDAHIRNTLKYLERTNACDMVLPWIIVFENELKRREKNE